MKIFGLIQMRGAGAGTAAGAGVGKKFLAIRPHIQPLQSSQFQHPGYPKRSDACIDRCSVFFLHQIKCKVPEKPIFRLVFYFALGWKKIFSANFTYIVSGNFKFSQADFQIFFRVAFCISREETKEIRVFFDSLTVKLSIFFSG